MSATPSNSAGKMSTRGTTFERANTVRDPKLLVTHLFLVHNDLMEHGENQFVFEQIMFHKRKCRCINLWDNKHKWKQKNVLKMVIFIPGMSLTEEEKACTS